MFFAALTLDLEDLKDLGEGGVALPFAMLNGVDIGAGVVSTGTKGETAPSWDVRDFAIKNR